MYPAAAAATVVLAVASPKAKDGVDWMAVMAKVAALDPTSVLITGDSGLKIILTPNRSHPHSHLFSLSLQIALTSLAPHPPTPTRTSPSHLTLTSSLCNAGQGTLGRRLSHLPQRPSWGVRGRDGWDDMYVVHAHGTTYIYYI